MKRFVAGVVVAVLLADAAPAWAASKWTQVAAFKGASPYFFTAVSRTELWAFSDAKRKPRSWRFDGRRWKAVPLPKGIVGEIWAAGGTPSAGMWAAVNAVDSGTGKTVPGGTNVVLRWKGGKWRVAHRFAGGPTQVEVRAENDVWVNGIIYDRKGSGAWHWNGKKWKAAPGPDGAEFFDISAVSAKSAWATGTNGDGFTNRIYRFNGTSWRDMTPLRLSPDGSRVDEVLALSDRNVWVSLSEVPEGDPGLLHWNGSSWRKYTMPYSADPLARDGKGGFWAGYGTRSFLHVTSKLRAKQIKAPGASALWTPLVTTRDGRSVFWNTGRRLYRYNG
ncbi:hypothetical protein GCM10027589_04980 [Actinocorallia lasiicapitis]